MRIVDAVDQSWDLFPEFSFLFGERSGRRDCQSGGAIAKDGSGH